MQEKPKPEVLKSVEHMEIELGSSELKVNVSICMSLEFPSIINPFTILAASCWVQTLKTGRELCVCDTSVICLLSNRPH